MGVAREIFHFLKLLVSRFIEHRGVVNAASLTYTTLLSLVPLLTVVFVVLAAFPVADRMGDMVRDFVFQNFVPESGRAVQAYLEQFIAKASELSGASFLFLFVLALMMMRNIDGALNAIWETHRTRGSVQKFLVYWALITLGPLLLAISLAATSYLVSLPFIMEAQESLHLGKGLLLFAPVIASMMAFSLMYLIIPNHAVPVRYAFAGGLVAAVLFDLANRAFGFYVTSFTSYQAIYGALAVIPFFLVWIFLSWVIFLLGAEFANCLERCRPDAYRLASMSTMERLVRVLAKLRMLQHDGRRMPDALLLEMLSGSPGLPERLEQAGLIVRTEKEQWALGRDLRDVSLGDLYRELHLRVPGQVSAEPLLAELAERVEAVNREIDTIFSVSLDSLLQAPRGVEEAKEKAGD
ncbi:MAG: YihY family inner membrane protein [Gammaproteobacteria bacterium]